MRLINAYTLPDALFQKHVHYGEGTEMYLSFADILDVIDNAPIVDAIPVEWLRKVRHDDRLTIDDVETIDLIMTWWQKEQEEA